MRKNLNNIYGKERKVEVINAGVPGYNSFHIIKQFESKLKHFSPDLIINYQFFTDLSIIEYGNTIALQETYINSFNNRSKKRWMNLIVDKSYILTMFKIILKNKSSFKKEKLQLT